MGNLAHSIRLRAHSDQDFYLMSFKRTVLSVVAARTLVAWLNRTRIAQVIGCVFLCAFLASCEPSQSSSGARAPTTSGVNTQAPIAAISAPPGGGDRPLMPGQSGTEYMPNGMPALSPAKGINADLMFAEKISNEEARFKRLENAVADMRREFESVKPAIIRLSAVESDMQDLLTQLQTLTGAPPRPAANSAIDTAIPNMPPMADTLSEDVPHGDAPGAVYSPPPPPSMANQKPQSMVAAIPVQIDEKADPPVKKNTEPPKKPPISSAKSASGITIIGIRSGLHDGIVRLVLDISASTPHHADVDNTEHLLTIELPGAGWAGPSSGKFGKTPLLSSWTRTATEDGKGSIIAIPLQGKAKVVKDSVLPAGANASFRVVIDLKPQ